MAAALLGCFAAILAADIFMPILERTQPRWFMAIGYWGIEVLRKPLIVLTRMLEKLIDME